MQSSRNFSMNLADASASRHGKVLVLFAVLLPAMLAVVGLVLDGGILQDTYRRTQHVADAAATAAAGKLRDGRPVADAVDEARRVVMTLNGHTAATVNVKSPPQSGNYSGDRDAVEVELLESADTHFYGFVGGSQAVSVHTRAVAGIRPTTARSAIVVLDPDPPALSVPPLPAILPALPALVGGLEIEGAGTVLVDGAVVVNTEWGGFDENNEPTGDDNPPPYGIASLNLLTARRLRARDIRVVGGVDDPDAYGNFTSGKPSPLKAGKLPMPDPFSALPVPFVPADPSNVNPANRGGVSVSGLPIGPVQQVHPGVYDWLEILSGRAFLHPGIYIIRGVNPATQLALNILAAEVVGDGVMFYITDSSGYSAISGTPDSGDGETQPAAPGALTLLPSAVINLTVPGSRLTGISDSSSPYDGMLLFQRRMDRRPVAIVTGILGSSRVSGTVYAKWGHVILASSGTVETAVVAGTVRIVAVLPTTIAPTRLLLPPAEDVYLLE